MLDEKESNEGALVPLVSEGNLIARLNSEIASEVHSSLVRGNGCSRVSDMFVSRYGILGYTELSTVMGPYLGGVILFPKKLSLVLQFLGEKVWEKFKKDHFLDWGNVEDYIENLEDPRHYGVSFLDEVYYYSLYPEYAPIGSEGVDRINDTNRIVMRHLRSLDESIDEVRGYRSQDPNGDFSRLQARGFLPE